MQHCTFNIYRASLDFDKEFLNISADFPKYERSTPKNPVDFTPDLKISVLKPISNIAVKIFLVQKIFKIFP